MSEIRVLPIEDCFDGSYIRELAFEQDIDEAFIQKLGGFGALQYFRSFARPYFQLRKPGFFVMKGVEGNRSLRVTIYRDVDQTLAEIKGIIESCITS